MIRFDAFGKPALAIVELRMDLHRSMDRKRSLPNASMSTHAHLMSTDTHANGLVPSQSGPVFCRNRFVRCERMFERCADERTPRIVRRWSEAVLLLISAATPLVSGAA